MPPKKGSKKAAVETPTGPAGASKNSRVPAANTAGKKDAAPAPQENKQPSVQELIGGKSWTGKLPQTLFYEHTVRTGWGKPNYDMVLLVVLYLLAFYIADCICSGKMAPRVLWLLP